MRKNDLNKKKNLAKRRKKTQVFFTFAVMFIIGFSIWLTSNSKELNLDDTNAQILYYGSLIIIFIFTGLLFLLILELMKPTYILQSDLKMIYIRKSAKKVIEIPIIDINPKRVRARVKSRKKSKKPFGTLIIRTKNKRYKLKNIFDVEKVKEDILVIHERLAAYNEGYRQAELNRQEEIKKQEQSALNF